MLSVIIRILVFNHCSTLRSPGIPGWSHPLDLGSGTIPRSSRNNSIQNPSSHMAPDENVTYSIVPTLWSQITNGTFIYLSVCTFGVIPLPILIAILCLIYNTSVYIIYMLIYWYCMHSAHFSYSWEAQFPTIFTCHNHFPVILTNWVLDSQFGPHTGSFHWLDDWQMTDSHPSLKIRLNVWR